MSNPVRQQVQRHVFGAGSRTGAAAPGRCPAPLRPRFSTRAGWRRDRGADDGEHPE